jgi:ribosomal protein L11 methyltransferase
VLDVGTGSGVLAIAAWRLGARDVIAIDTDEDAVSSACENVALNRAGRAIAVYSTGVAEFRSGDTRFDVVFANLTGATLIRFADTLVKLLAPAARLIVSGILDMEAAEVAAAFEGLGCRVAERVSEDEWIGLSLTSPTSSTA